MQEALQKEIMNWLDVGVVYLIVDINWVNIV